MSTQPRLEQLLSPDQVADMLGIDKRTLWKWEAAGKCPPAIRMSRKIVRFKLSEVNSFICNALKWPLPKGHVTAAEFAERQGA